MAVKAFGSGFSARVTSQSLQMKKVISPLQLAVAAWPVWDPPQHLYRGRQYLSWQVLAHRQLRIPAQLSPEAVGSQHQSHTARRGPAVPELVPECPCSFSAYA